MSQVFGPRYSEDIYDSTASTVAIDEYEYQYNEIDYDAYETSSMPFGIGYILGVGMGVALLITGFIFFYVAHYNYWKLVQRPDVTTTPGKAVGYLFIPFYNFYWIFVSFRGLAVEINKTAAQKKLPNVKTANVGVATAFCILLLLCNIPIVNFLALPATQVLLIIMAVNQKKVMIQIAPNELK